MNIFSNLESFDEHFTKVERIVLTPDDLDAAKAQNYEQGYQDGQDRAKLDYDDHLIQILQGIERHLELLFRLTDNLEEEHFQQGVQLCLEICRKLLPHWIEQGAEKEVMKNISDIFTMVSPKSAVKIYLNPQTREKIRSHFDSMLLQKKELTQLQWIDDESMTLADCFVGWGVTSAGKKIDELWQEIESHINIYRDNIVTEEEHHG